MGASKLKGYDTELIVNGRKLFALGHHARLKIIQILEEEGGCNLDCITEKVVLSKSTVKDHVDKLKAANLVKGIWNDNDFQFVLNKQELDGIVKWLEVFEENLQ